MSTEEKQGNEELKSTEERRNAEPETDEHHQVVDEPDRPEPTEKPEVTDEHKEKAKEMAKEYDDNLQTTTLPGSGGTVSGTAVTDWVDENDKGNVETSAEEGKVEYRKTDEFRKKQEQ